MSKNQTKMTEHHDLMKKDMQCSKQNLSDLWISQQIWTQVNGAIYETIDENLPASLGRFLIPRQYNIVSFENKIFTITWL